MITRSYRLILVFIAAFTVLPYLLQQVNSKTTKHFSPNTIYSLDVPSTIFYDVSLLSSADQINALQLLNKYANQSVVFQPLLLSQFNQQQYVATQSILIQFNQFSQDKYDYSVTIIEQGVLLSDLYLCGNQYSDTAATSACISSGFGLYRASLAKYYVDNLLQNQAPSLAHINVNSPAQPESPSTQFLSIFMIVLGISFTNCLIEDRVKGLKFALLMTGVSKSAYYVGLFFVPLVVVTLYVILSIVMTILFQSDSLSYPPMILLIIATAYSYLPVFFIISIFCRNQRTAVLLQLVYFVIGVLGLSLPSQISTILPTWLIIIMCINPDFARSIYPLVASNSPTGSGFTWNPITYSMPSLNAMIVASYVFMAALYVLALYLDWLQVSQDERRPFLYPLIALYKKYFSNKIISLEPQSPDFVPHIEESKVSKILMEEKISITNLTKIYNGSTVKAVNNVSLEFSKGEIFGIIGYNGAGKSTIINILTGVLSATEGNIKVFGSDSRTDRKKIAAQMGICSQQDILYDSLTVKDHLYFFGLMRGVPRNEIANAITKISSDLKMDEDFLNQTTKTLSGGQKRKVCIALAFIHDPQVAVLDEMSSGVDPENRRIIWGFLQEKKEKTAILLCTHFMDEADFLCDRKAMITTGKVACIGTSNYLKKAYDTGYSLSIEKTEKFNEQLFSDWFKSHGVEISLIKENETIADYSIGPDKLGILTVFEAEMKDAIKSYSVKENGLEQIFSSKELANTTKLQITEEEKAELLSIMNSLYDSSAWKKTFYFIKFEFRRSIPILPISIARMFLSYILMITICVLITSNVNNPNVSQQTVSTDTFTSRMVLPGSVLKTDISSLIQQNSNVFVGTDYSGSSTIMGTATLSNKTVTINLNGAYIGAPFLVFETLTNLLTNSKVTTELDVVSLSSNSVLDSISTYVTIVILFTQTLFDLAKFFTDEISESREKVKFLMLSAGVPLLSYWFVVMVRIILLALPILIPLVIVTPYDYFFGKWVFALLIIQIPLVAAFWGSALPKDLAQNIVLFLRYGDFILLILVQLIEKWISTSFFQFIVSVHYSVPPWIPMSFFFDFFRQLSAGDILTLALLPNSNYLIAGAVNFAAYVVLLFLVEMQHAILIRNVHLSKTPAPFVAFTNLGKRFFMAPTLRKLVRKKVAVNNLNLEIKAEELFAILGPNGCGKTTTLSMLTAQLVPTSGTVHLDSVHVASHKLKTIQRIGFCPQFDDLLIPTMTVGSHIKLFCTMNGASEATANRYVDLLLEAFGISQYKKYKCQDLSGGTKRKVSSVIALMLPKSLVVLDEASTGLDPLARQKLWTAVRLLNKGRTTIMTTHYINETSVCDRIAIMTDGDLRCVGSEHSLTADHAQGYKASLQFHTSNPDIQGFAKANILFDDADHIFLIDEVVGTVANVHFKKFSISLGTILSRLVQLKAHGLIKDFTISRMSLEHVFLELTKKSAVEQV